MSDEEAPKKQQRMVFENVQKLADFLDISSRRLRKLKLAGRINYTTDAVLVDPNEIHKYKEIQANYLAPYIPHRFRSRRGQFKNSRRVGKGPG